MPGQGEGGEERAELVKKILENMPTSFMDDPIYEKVNIYFDETENS